MSLDDIFGAFPGRPEHEDFRVLVDIVLKHDGKTEDPNMDFEAFLADYIDPASISHMAQQRAQRILAHIGRDPALNAQLVAAMASIFLDAFTLGADWEKRRKAD
jgi:hypothetical protein